MHLRTFKVLTAAVLLSCSAAHAGGSASTKVLNIEVQNDGRFIIRFTTPLTGSPSCSASSSAVSGDSRTPGGKAVLANAQIGLALGRFVAVDGTNTCDQFSNIETVLTVLVSNST